ncbi:Lrp/AsnC family transcriptional regulator [Dinghuibacter silviterrae]|uniref:Lrp/AsnC family leucine-responsive transcriptional regulator n=1 Tax=Dinghuibacter silviterrae TaxID=1539049 RepID=A0A4V3GMA2_9BACT|nr:Lrp/AsnC family transcriptional regulator [Dinghuibacter silviterrae]TDX02143.1 Lrp/AsnC family leucine-responsive transcriptional regulator [Dinghuibacter silviterrae]
MIDAFDGKILKLLTQNARMTGAEIARNVNLSLPAVTERLRKLGRSGIIDQYTIKLNRKQHVAGDSDLLLKVLVADTAALEELLVRKIKSTKAVTRTSTTIILSTYKEEVNPKTL